MFYFMHDFPNNWVFNLPAKLGAMSTMLAIAPAYAAVIKVTAINQTVSAKTILQPK